MSKIILACALLAIFRMVVSTDCPYHFKCPGNVTCCVHRNGSVGCCEFENSTCCPDGIHCCHDGKKCDMKIGRCVKPDNSFLAFASLNISIPTLITPAKKIFPDIPKLVNCGVDIYDIAEDVKTALVEFLKMTEKERKKAKYIIIEELIKKAPNMAINCMDIIKDLFE